MTSTSDVVSTGIETPAGVDAEALFDEGLRQLRAAIAAEAYLTDEGQRVADAALESARATRQRLRWWESTPMGASAAEVPAILFVTGMHRTGTTLLQNLLAEHPGLRSPRLWELMSPVGGRDPDSFAPLVARAQAYVDEYYRAAPDFRAIHPLAADRPEECHRLVSLSFMAEIYALRYRVPSYRRWLAGQDLRLAYGVHRLALRAILWRLPASSAVVMKGPFHLGHADAMAAVYPHARVVRLHRDPVVTLGSVCSLTAVVRRARSSRVDNAEIGEQWWERTQALIDEMQATGPNDGFGALPVLDVGYPELLAEPVRVVGRVCDFLGVPLTGEAERRMRAYLDGNPANSHGVHRYRVEDFGLSTSDIARRFADYRAQFNI